MSGRVASQPMRRVCWPRLRNVRPHASARLISRTRCPQRQTWAHGRGRWSWRLVRVCGSCQRQTRAPELPFPHHITRRPIAHAIPDQMPAGMWATRAGLTAQAALTATSATAKVVTDWAAQAASSAPGRKNLETHAADGSCCELWLVSARNTTPGHLVTKGSHRRSWTRLPPGRQETLTSRRLFLLGVGGPCPYFLVARPLLPLPLPFIEKAWLSCSGSGRYDADQSSVTAYPVSFSFHRPSFWAESRLAFGPLSS